MKTSKQTKQVTQKKVRERPPATTPEAREKQLVALAYDLVEKRLKEGSATSQETTHFLKRGTIKEKIEQDILELQKELIKAKTESINSTKRIEELYTNALNAMRTYSGDRRGDKDD